MYSILQILLMILGIVRFIVFAHLIMSWLINFQVLNLRQPLVQQIWYGLQRILDPIYQPLRRYLTIGGLDLSPIVLLVGIAALEIVLQNNARLFY